MAHLLEDEIRAILEAEDAIPTDAGVETTEPAVDITPPESPDSGLKMVVDVNKNPTKKGIKLQFIVPQGTDEAKKEEITQKLKTKLNKGLAEIGLSVDTDLDVPYQNVVGFLIRLESFKLFIKNILNPKSDGQENNTEPTI
jgi:hypothetical protein